MISHDVSMKSEESPKILEKLPTSVRKISPLAGGRSNNIFYEFSSKELEIPNQETNNIRNSVFSPKKKHYLVSKSRAQTNNPFKNTFGIPLSKKQEDSKENVFKARNALKVMVNGFKRRKSYKKLENLTNYHFDVIGDKVNVYNQKNNLKLGTEKSLNILKFIIRQGNFHLLIEFLRAKFPAINPNNLAKIIWDFVIMTLSFVKLFCYSLERSFSADIITASFDTFLIVFLYLDVLISFNTRIYTKGKEVTDRLRIMKYVMTSKALSEILPVLGLSLAYFSPKHDFLYEFHLLLIFRLAKAVDILKRIKEKLIVKDKFESLYNLVILFSKILLWAHIFACLWHIVGRYSMDNNIGDQTWITKLGLENKCWDKKYLHSVYWSVTTMLTVGYGDITPTNPPEMILNILAMFLGCGMFGYSMSRIAEILKQADRAEKTLEEQMDKVSLMMRDKQLPLETQTKIKKYLEFVWKQENKEDPENEKIIMNKLSSNLRDEIYFHTNVKYLKKIPAFKAFSDQTLIKLSGFMRKIRVSPEEYLYKEGDDFESSVFFVIEGNLDLIKERESYKGNSVTILKKYKKDDYFGLQELFTGLPRSLGVRSSGFSTLFKLTRKDMVKVLQINSEEYEKFCRLKDLDLIYSIKDKYLIKCNSCGFYDHSVERCNFLKYNPVKFIIIGNHLFQKSQFSKKFKRQAYPTKNALKNKNTNISNQVEFMEIYKDDDETAELVRFYHDLGFKVEPFSIVDISEIEEKEEGQSQQENAETTGDKILPSIDLTKSKINPNPSNGPLKLGTKQKGSFTALDQSEGSVNSKFSRKGKNHLSGATSRSSGTYLKHKEKTQVQVKEHDQSKHLDFDQIRSYKYYFPCNNVENVLRKMNNLMDPSDNSSSFIPNLIRNLVQSKKTFCLEQN